MMRFSVLAAPVALVALATGISGAPQGGRAVAADPPETVLHEGDRVRVEGQPIGCRVARQDGEVVVDCRRAGRLAGSYGTMLSSRNAIVVRFRSNQTAKVVFTATHRGAARRCH